MKRLNIFVDETGEFGFGNGASELYGVSFVNVNLFLDKNVNFKFGHFDSFYTIIFCYFLTVQFYLLFYMNYLLY